jgi:hypothetical protein
VICGGRAQEWRKPHESTLGLRRRLPDSAAYRYYSLHRGIYIRLPESLGFSRFENHRVLRCHHRTFSHTGELTLGPEVDGE